jgi:hypothetical protein
VSPRLRPGREAVSGEPVRRRNLNRRAPCPLCGEELASRAAAGHDAAACPGQCNERISFACGAALRPHEVARHDAACCPRRFWPCPVGCRMDFPAPDLPAHTAARTGRRRVDWDAGRGRGRIGPFGTSSGTARSGRARAVRAVCGTGKLAVILGRRPGRRRRMQEAVPGATDVDCVLRMAARDLQVRSRPSV